MKKLIVLLSLLLLFSFGFATLEWCGNSLVRFNDEWYDASNGWEGFSDFHGYDFGTIESMVLGGEVESWDKSGDYAKLGYMIDGGDPVYIDLPYFEELTDNDKWQSSPGTTIDISELSSGVHSLAVWFWVHDNEGSIDVYDNNNLNEGNNYVASFTIPEGEVPITLASFTAEALQGKVELAWVTESETENAHFLVYRDGEVIAQAEGNGTTTEQHRYSYLDTRVQAGVHRYALADVSYGGVVEMHESIEVEVEAEVEAAAAEFVLNKAYPNPFNPRTVISMHYAVGSNTVLNIYNTQGVLVDQLINGFVETGYHEVTWDATGFPSGIYFVRMMAGDMVQSMKIVLMK